MSEPMRGVMVKRGSEDGSTAQASAAVVSSPPPPSLGVLPRFCLSVTNADRAKDFIKVGRISKRSRGVGGQQRRRSSAATSASSGDMALATLDKVKHLGTPKLLADVETLTRNQMRSFLESLGCKKVSWKCEVLRKQIRAVITARGAGSQGKDDLRAAAESAHYTQKQIKNMAIEKIQKICLPPKAPAAQQRQVARQQSFVKNPPELERCAQETKRRRADDDNTSSDSAPTCTDSDGEVPHGRTSHGVCSSRSTAIPQPPPRATPQQPEEKESVMRLCGDVENLTRSQMRDFLHKLGVPKVSWKCETLRQQVKAVLEAKAEGETNLKQVAIEVGMTQALTTIQNSVNSNAETGAAARQVAAESKPAATMLPSNFLNLIQRQNSINVVGNERSHSEISRKLLKAVVHKGPKTQKTRMDGLLHSIRGAQGSSWFDNSQGQKAQSGTPTDSKGKKVVASECKFKGVTYSKATSKFEAHNWIWQRDGGEAEKGRQVYLGQYDTASEAAVAYDLSVLSDSRDQLTELMRLKDVRTKHSIRQILNLNNSFSSYEDKMEKILSISKAELISCLANKQGSIISLTKSI
ncbi:hypothetical protein A3770_20p85340 [Chloropicon primus]|uniref:AP2/ERF domain-containing protein n=1 Tax=Chloropicon primus TaxID=1764295 RepID=A0A5B8N156_9CHLO|nr:hypothetical protein A3770_20p85340 [Chloropicon primus]|mmetsp:Transcript_22587/g.47587  ORF Transcript_22587/g.47587 Transcript_22587/m.47587 type:complete len:580 (-) Transcript_22587:94-1833(-)|eukprot:QDZ26016.1 hypothetical protein A3770_20p85340 [Chloropicon primus]